MTCENYKVSKTADYFARCHNEGLLLPFLTELMKRFSGINRIKNV
ncbi:hypothetical protein BH09VER1_BH09VER1_42890 [soil metagenome]